MRVVTIKLWEESILLLLYFVGFAVVGTLLYIAAHIMDKLVRDRVLIDHQDSARAEMAKYEMDRQMRTGLIV